MNERAVTPSTESGQASAVPSLRGARGLVLCASLVLTSAPSGVTQEAPRSYRTSGGMVAAHAVGQIRRVNSHPPTGGAISRSLIERLAQHVPGELLRQIGSGALSDSQLSYAAELVAGFADRTAVESALLPLLNHSSALVREGAIYGLASEPSAGALAVLTRLAREDSSRGVRDAASDAVSFHSAC